MRVISSKSYRQFHVNFSMHSITGTGLVSTVAWTNKHSKLGPIRENMVALPSISTGAYVDHAFVKNQSSSSTMSPRKKLILPALWKHSPRWYFLS